MENSKDIILSENSIESTSLKQNNHENPLLKEYERNIQNLELVNERLKLNDESKRFIFSKMNMFNNYQQGKNLEIGSELERFNRKK
jgi:hypothetical protein